MGEQLPLATIQEAILEFLQNREDAVLFDAQAVNAWVDEPRMTQDVDLLSFRAKDLAKDIRTCLAERFQIAVRVREVKTGLGYRVYQLQKEGNRHLVDIRAVDSLPPAERIEQVTALRIPSKIPTSLAHYPTTYHPVPNPPPPPPPPTPPPPPPTHPSTHLPFRDTISSEFHWMSKMAKYIMWGSYVENALEKRTPYREAHLQGLQEQKDNGILKALGPTTDNSKVFGIYEADSEATVRQLVEADPYWQNGIWTEYQVYEWNQVF